MDIVECLKRDYERFPQDQTYSLYVKEVYFKDPMIAFRGRDRYRAMIGFIRQFFIDCNMDLHGIRQDGDVIRTDWTLKWRSPLPWKPPIAISGWSELTLNSDGLIVSHVDYWHCSKLDVLKQHFAFQQS